MAARSYSHRTGGGIRCCGACRASGGEPERVAGVAENAADPVFSRDGRMAYAQFFQDANIWRIDTAGKGSRRSR